MPISFDLSSVAGWAETMGSLSQGLVDGGIRYCTSSGA